MAKPPHDRETRLLDDEFASGDTPLFIKILSGAQKGEMHALPHGRPFILGSSPEASLPIEDDAVSRLHLELMWDGQDVRAKDLGSTNGSTFEGTRFQALTLTAGAVIRIGETELMVIADQDVEPLPPSEATAFGPVLGRSRKMRNVFAILERAAKGDSTVLVTGETGTGKEVVAEAIHRESARADSPFVVVDCASIPANLIESELFGHVKGAYTHAMTDRTGAFVQADGGTIFLDEVGELPVDLQPRLLRVLETQTVKPVGSNAFRKVDVRIVAATNRDLEDMVRARRFRSDLFFRLAVIRVMLPPLRERLEDVPLLARHFAERYSEGGRKLAFTRDVVAGLISHHWPGNVRELRNVIHQAVSLSTESLSLALKLAQDPGSSSGRAAAPVGFELYYDLPFRDARKEATAAFELAYLKHRVAECDGNVSEAAKQVGLHRNMVHRILAREKGGASGEGGDETA